ncbi:hypothetical protein CbuD7D7780_09340 [Coxiella burnetii]|nr:hypothetical protein CbuD7E6568_09320 [Coxiella burnetii]OYK81630.1 hypothetical protein CbuD7D7780_09340 [Coxiella burnetii]
MKVHDLLYHLVIHTRIPNAFSNDLYQKAKKVFNLYQEYCQRFNETISNTGNFVIHDSEWVRSLKSEALPPDQGERSRQFFETAAFAPIHRYGFVNEGEQCINHYGAVLLVYYASIERLDYLSSEIVLDPYYIEENIELDGYKETLANFFLTIKKSQIAFQYATGCIKIDEKFLIELAFEIRPLIISIWGQEKKEKHLLLFNKRLNTFYQKKCNPEVKNLDNQLSEYR